MIQQIQQIRKEDPTWEKLLVYLKKDDVLLLLIMLLYTSSQNEIAW